jgi:nucleoside-diphosphate-sugar epimerase
MKDKFPFSIVQVIPGTVMGPSELVTSAAEAYAQMDRMSKAILFNEMKPRYVFGFVHIDDCARVHVEALDEVKVPTDDIPDWFVAAASTAPGKNGTQIWNEVGDMTEQHFAKEVVEGLFTVGRDNSPVNMPFRVDSRLTEKLLLDGEQFQSLEDCIKDVGHWYARLVEESKSA